MSLCYAFLVYLLCGGYTEVLLTCPLKVDLCFLLRLVWLADSLQPLVYSRSASAFQPQACWFTHGVVGAGPAHVCSVWDSPEGSLCPGAPEGGTCCVICHHSLPAPLPNPASHPPTPFFNRCYSSINLLCSHLHPSICFLENLICSHRQVTVN